MTDPTPDATSIASVGRPPLPYRLAGPLPLSRSTLDRAAHRRDDAEWLAAAWGRDDTRVLTVNRGRAAVDGDRLVLRRPAEAPAGERFFLGVDEVGRAYFAVHAVDPLQDGHSATLREVGALLSDRDAGLLVHAVALANWHATHGYCSRCGAATEVASAGHIRRCPVDGSEHYPRTDPAIIVLAVDADERCLLGRGANWPPGRFSTLAGFVEPGESLEQAVEREVDEEVGVRLFDVTYAGNQPWPFPSSLMLGFYARAEGGPVQVDGTEIAEARWFSRTEFVTAIESGDLLTPGPLSIAGRLIEGWLGKPLSSSW